MTQSIQLPFKPYRVDEVMAITGVSFAVWDAWVNAEPPLLQLHVGEDADRTHGLTHEQCFAVFVGVRFLHEGAPRGRAETMVRAVQMWSLEMFEREFAIGNTFLAVDSKVHCMVPAPKSHLGARLNLKRLMAEFNHHVRRVFPRQQSIEMFWRGAFPDQPMDGLDALPPASDPHNRGGQSQRPARPDAASAR